MNGSRYDLLIIGGGMVGASLACALAEQPLRVGVIEAYPFGAKSQPSYDERTIALAYGSRRIFESMGLWSRLAEQVTPIYKIHVSNRGHFGFARLDRDQYRVDALGYVVANRHVGGVLFQRMREASNISLVAPATVTALEADNQCVRVRVAHDGSERELVADLVVAADGEKSVVRSQLAIPCERIAYDQAAVIANVTPAAGHGNVAYERFTHIGPIAFLPMSDNRCSVVWTVAADEMAEKLKLSDEQFVADLQDQFGFRLGRLVKVGKRHAYPLSLVRAREHVRPRVALIGNAAHTLHPVAGQGFNLGIRDVAVLAQVLMDARRCGRGIGEDAMLQEYARWRDHDHRQVIRLTDGLARLFVNPLAPVVLARNAGMVALDFLPPLKRMFARQTMGLAGRLPRLARGLPV